MKPAFKFSKALCRSASSEPRNLLLPLAVTAIENNREGYATALLTGTSSRSGQEITAWIRKIYFRGVPAFYRDGRPIVYDGVQLTDKELTGKSETRQSIFNCKNRTSGTLSITEYASSSVTPTKSEFFPKDLITMTPVVPNTIGERELEVVCAIYGDSQNLPQ